MSTPSLACIMTGILSDAWRVRSVCCCANILPHHAGVFVLENMAVEHVGMRHGCRLRKMNENFGGLGDQNRVFPASQMRRRRRPVQ